MSLTFVSLNFLIYYLLKNSIWIFFKTIVLLSEFARYSEFVFVPQRHRLASLSFFLLCRYAPGDLSGYSGERNPASAVIRHPVPISLGPVHLVQAQLQAGALSTSSTVRSDNGSQIISMYHSPRVRRASTAINHYYPDRTHSRRVPHSCLASRRSFIHARPVTVVPRESARGCLPTPPASITSLYIIISQWTIFVC